MNPTLVAITILSRFAGSRFSQRPITVSLSPPLMARHPGRIDVGGVDHLPAGIDERVEDREAGLSRPRSSRTRCRQARAEPPRSRSCRSARFSDLRVLLTASLRLAPEFRRAFTTSL